MAFLDKLKFWKKGDDAFAELDKQLGTLPQTGLSLSRNAMMNHLLYYYKNVLLRLHKRTRPNNSCEVLCVRDASTCRASFLIEK